MTFIMHQNRRSFVWLWRGIFLFILFIFFVFGGRSIVIRGTIKISNFFSFSKNIEQQSSKLGALQAKITDLEADREHINELLTKTASSKKVIPANISLGGGYLFSDSIIIDHGTYDGVELGDIVTTNDGIFVGSVSESGVYWSKIIPFTQLGRKTVIRGGPNKEIIFEINGIIL